MPRKKSPAVRAEFPIRPGGSDFGRLVQTISSVHEELRRSAVGAVSRAHTIRNWLIGYHIVVFEQKGEDRAQYGVTLLRRLSEELADLGMRGVSETALRSHRQFYATYPQLGEVVALEIQGMVPEEIQQQPTAESLSGGLRPQSWRPRQIQQEPPAEFQPIKNQQVSELSPTPAKLLRHFSFTHFVELMRVEDPLKRAFYEIEGIKGAWSVPQLKRQIGSFLFERTGLSKNKAKVVADAHAQNVPATIEDTIRDPYILEFAGLRDHYAYSEADLETAILDHIQEFLLELGAGFCFEARQKRITLDNEHDRIDLVFYHRVLRCHVLIDLKVRKFQHGDAGQMNFYLNYYRDKMMQPGDNPPVGLILCTHRDETVVKYATGGLDNRLFVSKYLTALPSEEKIRAFLASDREETEFRVMEERARYGERARSQQPAISGQPGSP